MEEEKILDYNWEFGKEKVRLSIDAYTSGGTIFIGLESCDENGIWEEFGDLTVNLPHEYTEPDEAFISNFGSKDKIRFIEENGLGRKMRGEGHSGFCTYAKVAFDLERLRELDPEGMERFYQVNPDLKPIEPKRQNGRSR